MKKRILSVLVIAAMLGLTSCGVSEATDKAEEAVEVVTEAYDDEEEKTEDVVEADNEGFEETVEETAVNEVTAAGKDDSLRLPKKNLSMLKDSAINMQISIIWRLRIRVRFLNSARQLLQILRIQGSKWIVMKSWMT